MPCGGKLACGQTVAQPPRARKRSERRPIRGVDDESIGIDGRFDERSRAALVGTDTIAARSVAKDTVTLTDAGWGSVREKLVGQYLTVATGSQQGPLHAHHLSRGPGFQGSRPQEHHRLAF